MRPELLGEVKHTDPPVLSDLLAVAGIRVSPDVIAQWVPLERLVVADWALREHLHASDQPVRRRPRPALLGVRGQSLWTGHHS